MNRRQFLELSISSYFFTLFNLNNSVLAFNKTDQEIFAEKIQFAINNNLNKLPLNQIIIQIAKSFIGTPYKDATLDIHYPEELIINLREFDCVTFIENVLAISFCIRKNKLKFDDFARELQFTRYRQYTSIKYSNRLHYFTDWLFEGQNKKILCLIKGNNVFPINVSLLSKSSINKEKNTLKLQELYTIQNTEKLLSKQNLSGFSCDSIESIKIKDGDIIGFVSNVQGLDFNHTAFAYQNTFIHASSINKRIEINKDSLINYCPKVKRNKGIVIARPL